MEDKNLIPETKYREIQSLVPIATVLIVVHQEGKVLICRRNIEPRKGEWCLPGGRVNLGETLGETVLREAKEELGIEVKIERQIGTFDSILPQQHYTATAYLVTPVNDEEIKLNEEHIEYKWVESVDELSETPVRQAVMESGVLK